MSVAKRAIEASCHIKPVQANGWPIFRLDCPDDTIFYTPGYLGLVSLRDADQFEMMLTTSRDNFGHPTLVELRDTLIHKAETTVATRHHWQTAPFYPECLTLYLTNQCNLRCLYCYANASPHSSPKLKLKTIRAAAKLVAKSCKEKNCTFTTVFHGGGEPTLDRDFAEQVLTILDEVAQDYAVSTFYYIATNGVMSKNKARWLARHFDMIGLSCDGPPDIQNNQRPTWGGGETAHLIEQTAQILHKQGRQFHVRVTITKMTMKRQAEIADYVCRQLSPTAIHLEPLYYGGRAANTSNFEPADAIEFVDHFWQARARAAQYRIPLVYAGSRLDSIHGPYCQIFRHVLNLVPGGVATACFKVTTAQQATQRGTAIGTLNEENGQFIINHQTIEMLRQSLAPISNACHHCFNQFHCVGECPGHCLLAETNLTEPNLHRPGFRCQTQKMLAMSTLLETADRLRAKNSDTVFTNGNKTKHRYAWETSIV